MPIETTNIAVRVPGSAAQNATTAAAPSTTRRAFSELVDAANPLQHVPLVSQTYRAATGDRISGAAKFAGHVGLGAAVGGPIGAAVGAGVFLLESLFGKFAGRGAGQPKNTQIAVDARPAAQAPAINADDKVSPLIDLNRSGPRLFDWARRDPPASPMSAGPLNGARVQAALAQAGAPLPAAPVEDSQQANRGKTEAVAAPQLGQARRDLTSAQFLSLLSAFGSTPAADRDDVAASLDAAAPAPQPVSDDFLGRLRANLERYQDAR